MRMFCVVLLKSVSRVPLLNLLPAWVTGVIITAGRTAIERLTYSVQLKFKRHIGYLKNNMSCEKHDLDLDLDAHYNHWV